MNQITWLLVSALLQANPYSENPASKTGVQAKAEESVVGQSFQDLADRLKKERWKVDSVASSPKPTEAVVLQKGSMPNLAGDQKVKLKFGWVVLNTKKIAPNKRQIVTFAFNSKGEQTTEFETTSGGREEVSTDMGDAKGSSGSVKIEETFETGPNEEKMEVALQRMVQIYDLKGKLIDTGYGRTWSTARLIRQVGGKLPK